MKYITLSTNNQHFDIPADQSLTLQEIADEFYGSFFKNSVLQFTTRQGTIVNLGSTAIQNAIINVWDDEDDQAEVPEETSPEQVYININGHKVSTDELLEDVDVATDKFLSHQYCFTYQTVRGLLQKIDELTEAKLHR